jgi:hypothetical protein
MGTFCQLVALPRVGDERNRSVQDTMDVRSTLEVGNAVDGMPEGSEGRDRQQRQAMSS